ncbi:Antitoxin component YwqK of the YwqJK toxin-antitoxin module [Hyunsoonleella jejuensis]|uniref:Antitoxin component YwqK of the YwqJK toxin-antitoxin module n=1 Tax=Hyunsoonleella jejuensis TaxID=419940 RepID=A0A1H9A8D5_9FLAO|nr:energy transducer TonB [Hyunsoonleella jejuensis]SEP72747.1 Antitoxin component YwqK of the YwqJK toxin-antitoxin module [Hyunsoonleella jejuensis]
MRYSFIFLLLCSTLYSFSQKIIEDGPFVKYFENGQVKTSGHYEDNKKVGDWQDFYETGELKMTYSYTDGKMDTERKSFFKSGIVKTERTLINGDKVFKKYFDTGKLHFEKKVDGGYAREYFINGNLKSEGQYVDKELSGIWKKYYETGELEWEVAYVDNYKQGRYTQFYKNQNIKVEGENKKDKIHGLEKRYDTNGKLKWEGKYSDGKLHGKWTEYSSDGSNLDDVKFKNGVLLNNSNTNLEPTLVPDGFNERIPIYPGCENVLGFKNQKKCLSKSISEHVAKSFNTEMAANLGLEGRQRVNVIFKIDKQGKVIDAKSRAPHPLLEIEAIRVVKLLPKMKPGMQLGKPVVVPYSLPIVFAVQEKRKN